MNVVFDACVRLLEASAHALGMSYQEINVLIFCVFWPVATLALGTVVVQQRRTIRRLLNPDPFNAKDVRRL